MATRYLKMRNSQQRLFDETLHRIVEETVRHELFLHSDSDIEVICLYIADEVMRQLDLEDLVVQMRNYVNDDDDDDD